ncbi:MAG: synthase subunit [Actinomycetota bacterium]|jgi:F-type H+-transporting ATPase subunit b
MNLVQLFLASSEELHFDDKGVVTHSWLLPETAEIIYGGLASLIIFALLAKFAGPQIKKAMAARTARIQKDLDSAAEDKASASKEAADIRQAKGDIAAERNRILAEADAQAASVLAEGRARLATELSEIESRAQAEMAASATRVGDELRAEVARLSVAAVDHVVTGSLDAATQQELIENFISRVGAGR